VERPFPFIGRKGRFRYQPGEKITSVAQPDGLLGFYRRFKIYLGDSFSDQWAAV
jgi:hypothetical protein